MDRRRLLLVGSGIQPFREYALEAISRRAQVVLAADSEVTWQKPYLSDFHRIDPHDAAQLTDLTRAVAPDGLLTYDEQLVEPVAAVAERLGIAHTAAGAISTCRDKSELRAVLDAAGLSPVRHAVAHDLAEARRAARQIGYPVVLKPRALGGSIGVIMAADDDGLASALAVAAGASASDGTVSARPGVLIEEYLDGPEYSVDCVTWQRRTVPLIVAEKELGFPPCFEEVGHIVPGAPHPDLAAGVDLVVRAHAVIGLDRLVSHSEVKLTSRGPRIVEVNARLGGDLIPYLGLLSSGADLAGAAAQVAIGAEPDIGSDGSRYAAVAMIYPARDLVLREVRLRGHVAGLERFATWVPAGTELRLPPDGFLSRIALAVVSAPTSQEVRERLEAVRGAVEVTGEPLARR